MSTVKKTNAQKSLLSMLAFISVGVPLLTLTAGQSAMAADGDRHCIDVENIGICAEEKGVGYDIYAQFGPLTSQKQYLGRDGGCATFGTIDVVGNHVQARGCIKSQPVRLEGKAEACGLGSCKSKEFTLNLANGSTTTPSTPTANTSVGKYELFWDGVKVGNEPSWTREQAIANLTWNKQTYPNKKVEGYFNGQKVGYELFWDGVRVGFEPSWNRDQALVNLEQNKKAYPNKKVEGMLNGQKVGYELYWDGVRVGFEPSWNRDQAIANLTWNKQTYTQKAVTAFFNGDQL